MARTRWIIGVVAVAAVGIAATFLPREQVPQAPPGPAPTVLGWTAQLQPLAGDGLPGDRDGAALQARFSDPYGLLALDDGGLLVADAGDNNRIRRIGPDGAVSTLAGSSEGFIDGPARQARFHTPSALARDSAGVVYVADTGNHAIRRIGLDGQVTTLAGGTQGFADGPATQARFDGPMGIAVDAHGNVYVADTWNDRIRVITPDGTVRTLAGGGEPAHVDGFAGVARFDTPVALAWDGHGALLVADFYNNAIRRVGMDGQVETRLASGHVLNGPLSLALSHDDVLYVGDRAGRIVQVSAQGHQIALVGTGQVPRLARPSGLLVAADGSLCVADAGAGRLHRVAVLGPGERPAPALVGPDPQAPLPRTDGRWPLAPQRGWHEVVGTLGEVRGNFRGESRHHLHDGFDVRGDVGQAVLAIADGKIDSPLSSWTVGGQAEGLEVGPLRYLHMRVGRDPRGHPFDARWQQRFDADGKLERIRLRRGTRIHAGDRLGSINSQAHVHLSVGSSGFERNAALLGFNGFVDTVAPRLTAVALLDDADQPLRADAHGTVAVDRAGRGVQIVVEAWDQVDGNLPRRRLGLYQVGYQVLTADGVPLPGYEQPRWTIEFNRMPPQREAVRVAYAPDSGITVHGSAVTRFRYLATNTVRDGLVQVGRWRPDGLAPGEYRIRAHARDHTGNAALGPGELRISVR